MAMEATGIGHITGQLRPEIADSDQNNILVCNQIIIQLTEKRIESVRARAAMYRP
jgi:hypothetical protein